jgi:peroxiredoxin
MRRTGRYYCLSLLLVGTALLTGCSAAQQTEAQRAAAKVRASRKPAPDFTLTDSNGAKVKLADYRGKVVLLNFWATWCGPCQVEIPWFQEFQQQYKSKGFEVLGVSMDDDGWSAVKPYIAAHKLNYRILLGDDSVAQLYGGLEALPTTFMIDREGKFAFAPHVGLIGKNDYAAEIDTLLKEKDEPASAGLFVSVAALFRAAK